MKVEEGESFYFKRMIDVRLPDVEEGLLVGQRRVGLEYFRNALGHEDHPHCTELREGFGGASKLEVARAEDFLCDDGRERHCHLTNSQ